MKKVYLCAPLGGDVTANLEKIRQYCRYALLCGTAPVVPHFYAECLDDSVPAEREIGRSAGMSLLWFCDELWLFGDTVTEGMVAELQFCKYLNIRIRRIQQNEIQKVCCATCGVPMRRLHDSRTSHQEKWVCQSCSTAIKITDTDLLRAITDRLNDLLADPEQVHYTPATHESPVELLRLKNEIGRMLDGTMIDKDLLKNKIFEYASRQYAELDAGERITMEMRVALLDTGPLSSYSAELVKAIVTDITLHADKSVTLTLKNGQQVRKEQSDGAHEHSA